MFNVVPRASEVALSLKKEYVESIVKERKLCVPLKEFPYLSGKITGIYVRKYGEPLAAFYASVRIRRNVEGVIRLYFGRIIHIGEGHMINKYKIGKYLPLSKILKKERDG